MHTGQMTKQAYHGDPETREILALTQGAEVRWAGQTFKQRLHRYDFNFGHVPTVEAYDGPPKPI